MKTELLIQMDGLSHNNNSVFLLAATNLPWDIDTAMLRRFEKRVYIELPNQSSRSELFSNLLNENENSTLLNYELLSKKTDGYSCSDINLM
jgi:SpoVK/Ycf46/Vps4 family AAA+-type ATPase